MQQFRKGDVVRVQYASALLIEAWMSGLRKVGPGDLGVVKFDPEFEQLTGETDERGQHGYHGLVTVTFPMLGTFGVHSSHLVLAYRPAPGETEGA